MMLLKHNKIKIIDIKKYFKIHFKNTFLKASLLYQSISFCDELTLFE